MHATLTTTNEPVRILHYDPAAGTCLCKLPPSRPWHRPRYQTINVGSLVFAKEKLN